MNDHRLEIEVLSGPLDGAILVVEEDAEWTRAGGGPLAFPWDWELGEPQARLSCQGDGWHLEGLAAAHGTYCVSRGERLKEGATARLEEGDMLKASYTWLLVQKAT